MKTQTIKLVRLLQSNSEKTTTQLIQAGLLRNPIAKEITLPLLLLNHQLRQLGTHSTSQKNKNKKMFALQNRYEVLRQDENLPTNSSTILTEQIDIETDSNVQNKPPPSIFVKEVEDFPELCARLIEIIGYSIEITLSVNLLQIN